MQASVLYQKKGQNRLKIWRSPQEAAFGYGHPLPVPVLVGCDGLLTVSALKVQNNSTWYEWDGILVWRDGCLSPRLHEGSQARDGPIGKSPLLPAPVLPQ